MIRIGMCAPVDKIEEVAAIGYDYLEANISGLTALDDEAFEAVVKAVEAAPIKVEAFNVLLPGTLAVVGPDAAPRAEMLAYLQKAAARVKRLGGQVVVFGSGKARTRPEGVDKAQSRQQILAFLHIIEEAFGPEDLTVVIEPLNKGECNEINLVSEAADFAREANLPHVKVLGDLFHMMREDESIQALKDAGALLRHTHVAEPVRRACPSPEDGVDYKALFALLADMGYDGRISVEGGTDDFAKDAPIALKTLKAARDA